MRNLFETEEEKKEFEELKTKYELVFKKIKFVIETDCEKVIVSKWLVVAPCVIECTSSSWYNNVIHTHSQKRHSNWTVNIKLLSNLLNQLKTDENDKVVKDMSFTLYQKNVLLLLMMFADQLEELSPIVEQSTEAKEGDASSSACTTDLEKLH